MNTQLQPITELDSLPADKQEILHEWIENLGYRKAMEKLKSEWQLEVTYNKVYRYYRRILQKQPFDDILEDEIAMSDFLALLNGKSVPYDQAGIELVMKRAFDLTCARKIKPSTLATLLRVFHYKKNCEWNQHRLAQNDKRIDIADRLARLKETSSSSQKNSSSSTSPREDHLGPLAKNMDGVEARAKKKFGSVSDGARGLQSESPGISESLPLAPAIHPGDASSNISLSSELQSGAIPNAVTPTTVSTVSTENSQPTPSSCASCPSVEETTSSPSSVVKKNADPCSSETSAVNPSAPSQSSQFPPVKSSPPIQSLEDRVNQYTLERYHEALHGKDTLKVGKWNAWKFKSKMQWCPCGQHLPCPEHGEFPPHFWELMPTCGDYIEILQRKKLPYTNPLIFERDQEKRAKRLAAEKELCLQFPNEDARNSMLNERAKSHALRRFYSHTPRPRGTPPPDESWTEECPCGAKLPCDLHDALWSEVRYMKPSDPDYSAALKREGIPVYTPTDEERRPWLKEPSSEPLSAPDSGAARSGERAMECSSTTAATLLSDSDLRIALPERAPVSNSGPGALNQFHLLLRIPAHPIPPP